MKKIMLLTLFGLLVLYPALPSRASTALGPKAALQRVFANPKIAASWFASSFLQVVPPSRMLSVRQDLETTLGHFRKVTGTGNPYTLVFAHGIASANIVLDAQGRIRGLRVFNLTRSGQSLATLVQQVRKLPGQTSLLILKNGQVQVAYHAGQSLAVGSAFKLAVLAALQKQIKQGRRHWNDIVHLQSAWKAFPSGILQNWPDNSPITLQTLATLMISISDNTAATALIHIVGRRAVEAEAPAEDRPFLTPLEAFKLKMPDNQALLKRYLAAAGTARRGLLQQVNALPRPALKQIEKALSKGPLALQIEWFFNARQLCKLLGKVQNLPLMSVNPGGGLVNPGNWRHIAFKGGSEPGVLNLTTWLVSKTGNRYCVALTTNRTRHRIASTQVEQLYSSLLGQLRSTKIKQKH